MTSSSTADNQEPILFEKIEDISIHIIIELQHSFNNFIRMRRKQLDNSKDIIILMVAGGTQIETKQLKSYMLH